MAALNRAVALAERDRPATGPDALDRLTGALDGYHLLHAARGDALERLGRREEAVAAFERATALTANAAEMDLLRRRSDVARH